MVDVVEDLLEALELLEGWFAHQVEDAVRGVFRCYLEASADVMEDEFAGVIIGGFVDCGIACAM